ncbi:hypothetical protein LOK49_LG09G02350 [Camellia lanceoleosa]|uniref:Uncharacterized protein n=1 Tax=Camellia lanceoleosa TaxID=1840588 RepID=A0ACC0GK78_9ERIC|nr:hypothetical protein LOK49_LG09G02350 [Camellia lanceoleosa]
MLVRNLAMRDNSWLDKTRVRVDASSFDPVPGHLHIYNKL